MVAQIEFCSRKNFIKTILFVLCCLLVIPLITHYYLIKVESSTQIYHRSRSQLEVFEDYNSLKAADLKLRIDEMLRIKSTVSMELRELESRRQKIQIEIGIFTQRIDELKQELMRQQAELERLKISVEQAMVSQREAILRNTPELALPKQLYPESVPTVIREAPVNVCSMNCFDYSRCSLTSGFPIYLYDPEVTTILKRGWDIEGFLKTTIKQTFGYNSHITQNPAEACMYMVLIGEALPENEVTRNNRYGQFVDDRVNINRTSILGHLSTLKYWGGDGRNHLLLHLARRDLSVGDDVFKGINTGRAMIAQSYFGRDQYRPGFDIILPPILGPPGGDIWAECPFIVPARRRYLLTFQGELTSSEHETILDKFIIDHLKQMSHGPTQDKFLLQFECQPAIKKDFPAQIHREWSLCGTENLRKNVLKDSTFVLIFAPGHGVVSSINVQARLYEALRSGAIPIILGEQVNLPFEDTIDWRRIVLAIPKARITELHFLLRSVSDADLLNMRRQGRNIWEKYLSTVQAIVDTTVAYLSHRIGIPPRPIAQVPSRSVFNSSFIPLKSDPVSDAEPEESLGPIEPQFPSPAFKRNYTIITQYNEIWNDWFIPFALYPQLPFDPVMPSDAKFIGSTTGFRPIGKGAGGSGKEFSESLGGNTPREQFTIVILTYEREQVLMDSLGRLFGLPYLNKVIVVWNSPKPPLEDLRWPDIGVPVVVIKASRNSLNNRFLPFDAIETEAILSVDDDAHLRHDEILHGFRVWREQKDRIVGFPGRFHAWDTNSHNAWNYNSNYSCELSMVLTGAAFFHRHYTYLYSFWMPQAIRDKVDEYMNCEDIAMNFLVSHFTRKPPVKVTSRWTFRCPGCPVSLSEDDTHFQERHKCINFFAKVYGYTPLLNTQFRADSILFKTRIPHDKQKCFKFI